MEKKNMFHEMPAYQRMSDLPPNYNQSHPSTPSDQGAIQQQQPQQFTVQQPSQPTMIQNLQPIPPLGPKPCLVTCPCCHQRKLSNVRLESGTKTHLLALALCLVGLCCFVCVPYCMDSCQNANHYCGNCDAYLGTYKQ